MSHMFTDMNLSKELMGEFKKSKYGNNGFIDGIELNVEVLTNGHWPE